MKKELVLKFIIYFFSIVIFSGCQTFTFSESELKLRPYLGLWAGYNNEGNFVKIDIDNSNIYLRVFNTDRRTVNIWKKYSYKEMNNQFNEELIEYFNFETNEWKKQNTLEKIELKYTIVQSMLILEIVKYNDQMSDDIRHQIILQRPDSAIFTDSRLDEIVEIENSVQTVNIREIQFDSSSWKDELSLKSLRYISPTIVDFKLSKREHFFHLLLGNITLLTDRQRMLKNVLDTIQEKSKSEILNLLGNPLLTNYWKEENADLIYILGPEPGFVQIDSEWLLIWFKDDVFLKYELKTD